MDKKQEKIFSRPRINIIKFKKNKKILKVTKIIAIIIIAIIVFKVTINSSMPIIDEKSKTLAKAIATKISNEQATNVMANYKYEDLFKVEKDNENNVKFLSTDMITINKIISDIPKLIQNELEKTENNVLKIKLRKFFR